MINPKNRTETRRANNIDYIYEFLEDGWIAIYKFIDGLPWIPLIQAKTIDKADDYIALREEINVQINKIVSEG